MKRTSAHGRARSLLVGAGVAGLLAVSGCAQAGGGALVQADVARSGVTPAAAVDGGTVVRSVAGRLLGPIDAAHEDGNVAYSPVSIAIALGMLRAGVQGDSARQLDRLFGVDAAKLPGAMNATDRAIAALSGKPVKSDKRTIDLAVANAIWAQKGITWRQPFLSTLAADYGSGVRTLDFEQHPGDARDTINGWVADQTHSKIPELLPDGVITPDTRLTLTNALYLKAPWETEFTAAADGPFTTATGSSVSSKRMRQDDTMAYASGVGWQSVRIPYLGGQLAMTLVVPDAGDLDAIGARLADPATMETMLAPTGSRPVALTMPLFDLDTKTPLNTVLKSIGVTAPFSPAPSDFAPMTDDPKIGSLALADVRHQATVTVDEHGTEAAAATAVSVMDASARVATDPVTLNVDRPFYFAITTTADTIPLFVGRVTDPSVK
jgi:serpin B